MQEKVTIECWAITDFGKENWCKWKEIMHFNQVKEGDYEIVLEFVDIPGWKGLIEKLEFSGTTYNTSFIVFMLALRYFFLIFS